MEGILKFSTLVLQCFCDSNLFENKNNVTAVSKARYKLVQVKVVGSEAVWFLFYIYLLK